MPLYEVTVEATAYVWAKDRREAERTAEREINEVMDGADFTANEHGPGDAIYFDWVGSVPFGEAPEGFDNLTMDGIQAKWKEDGPELDPYTLPLPGME